ncbi:MAG: VCBS repeat-containing protein, partial [Bacteroidota bacterium]
KDTTQFRNLPINASQVIAVDYDNDSDLDIIITSDQVPHAFGKSPKQYLFENDGSGNFADVTLAVAPDLHALGNITDLSCVDVNHDGLEDIVAVGHWMPISILLNDGKTFTLQKNQSLETTHGWWNTVKVVDFDKDGDLDIVAGNWGLNSKFKASVEEPITLYSADFDNNGSVEPLVTYFHKHQETPFASKDELTKQMPGLNKKFLSYKAFANQGIADLFGTKNLEGAYKKRVYELASCYFINDGTGNFKKRILPFASQVSTVNDLWIEDFDQDGYTDILAVGNDYQISTQLGRMDASHGVFLRFDKKNAFESPVDWKVNIPGAARKIEKITIASQPFYIVGINDGAPIFLSKKEQ